MSKLQIEELIARLEKAAGPDRDLGNEILLAVGWRVEEDGDGPDRATYWISPVGEEFADGDQLDPTESIDAALTLVPEGCSVHMEIMTNRKAFCFTHNNVTATQGHAPGDFEIEKRKPPAIALCIAALKAIAAGDK